MSAIQSSRLFATSSTVAADAVAAIRSIGGVDETPRLGLILGSGMGKVAEAIEVTAEIPFEDIPGFPRSTVSGHEGKFILGTFNGMPVACLQGRVHLYEGIDPATLRFLFMQ